MSAAEVTCEMARAQLEASWNDPNCKTSVNQLIELKIHVGRLRREAAKK